MAASLPSSESREVPSSSSSSSSSLSLSTARESFRRLELWAVKPDILLSRASWASSES